MENGKYTLTEDDTRFIIVFKESKTKTEHYVEKESKAIIDDGDGDDDNPINPEEPEEIKGTVIFGNTVWNEGKASVTISTTTNYKIEYQKNSTSGRWTIIENGSSVTNLQHGDVIYARLTDGVNSGEEASKTIVDTISPTITDVTATANSITMRAIDNESGINGYAITTSYSTPSASSFTSITATSIVNKVFSGLTPNTTYYVWVKDQAGNISNGYAMKTVDDTPPDLNSSNVTFKQNPTGWTNGSVTVTATTTVSGYTLQTSKNASSWSNTNTQTFTTNGTMYARLINSSGTAGDYASYNVTNIDKTKPTTTGATATTNSISFRAIDYESGINGYAITTTNYTPSTNNFITVTNTSNLYKTITGLSQNTTYYIWVKDQAGNISNSYVMKTTEEAPPALTSSNVTFSQTPTGWTKQDVVVTVSTTETGYTLQTSQDLNSWTNTNKQTVKVNGPVYARLVNSSGIPGDYATYNVTNIDKTAPDYQNYVSIYRRPDLGQGIITFREVLEEQSGISKVILYYKTESENSYSSQTYTHNYPGSSTSHYLTYSAMFSDQYETYYMYAEIYDVAGNIRRTCTASVDYEGNTNYADDATTY